MAKIAKTGAAFFFGNGNTAFCDDRGQQVPELQESWLLLYAKFLEERGVDPLKVVFNLPGGGRARLFRTESGFNWQME